MLEMARILKVIAPIMKPVQIDNQSLVAGAEITEQLKDVASLGIIKSFSDGSWRLETVVTRGECVYYFDQFLGFISSNMIQAPVFSEADVPFSDISAEHWLRKPLMKLAGIGALAFSALNRFNPDFLISVQEIKSISSSFIDYLATDMLLIAFDGETVSVQSKGAMREIPLDNWSYSYNAINWQELSENGKIVPEYEGKRLCRIFFRHSEYFDAGPIQIFPQVSSVGYVKVHRNYAKVVRNLTTKSNSTTDPRVERERLRKRLEDIKSRKQLKHDSIEKPVSFVAQTETVDTSESVEQIKPVEQVDEVEQLHHVQQIEQEELLERVEQVEPVVKEAKKNNSVAMSRSVNQFDSKRSIQSENIEIRQTKKAIGLESYEAKVVDSLTGNSINGAIVILEAQQYSTGADGKFVFDAKQNKVLELTAYCEGYEPLQMKHRAGYRNRPLVLSLKPVLLSFSGKITCHDTDTPIARALVKIGVKAARTDSDGNFTINGLQSGYHQLSCFADKYMEAHEIVYVDKNPENTFKFSIKPLNSGNYGDEEAVDGADNDENVGRDDNSDSVDPEYATDGENNSNSME